MLITVLAVVVVLAAVASALHFVHLSVSASSVPDVQPPRHAITSAVATAPQRSVRAHHGHFRSASSHFKVTFPDSLLTARGPIKIDGRVMTVVTDPANGLTIEAAHVASPITASDRTKFFAGLVNGLTSDGQLRIQHSHRFTLRGKPADKVDLITATRVRLEAIAVIYPHDWTYLLVGPRGKTFTEFRGSLRHV